MILTGKEIEKQARKGDIIIEPFKPRNITTNSYDLTLGDSYIVYTGKILDPAKENKYKLKKIPPKGIILKKGDFILGHSKEIIGSTKFVPVIHAKSGIARLGLFVHITADLIDIGSIGNTTFQLYATKNIRLYTGMQIAQVSFCVTKGKIILYNGKYKKSIGPIASQIHKDFKEKMI